MSKKIVSIFDVNKEENHDHDHGQGQAFYAGGSEHSGQQILGPDRDNNLIENLLNHARQHAQENPTPSNESLAITLWRNGFTIGDEGELRDYASNRQFLDCLKRGEVPPELSARVRGGLIDVKLDNKATQDYKPDQRTQVFAGEGRRLGAPSPAVVSSEDPQQSSVEQPTRQSINEARLKRFQKPKDPHS